MEAKARCTKKPSTTQKNVEHETHNNKISSPSVPTNNGHPLHSWLRIWFSQKRFVTYDAWSSSNYNLHECVDIALLVGLCHWCSMWQSQPTSHPTVADQAFLP